MYENLGLLFQRLLFQRSKIFISRSKKYIRKRVATNKHRTYKWVTYCLNLSSSSSLMNNGWLKHSKAQVIKLSTFCLATKFPVALLSLPLRDGESDLNCSYSVGMASSCDCNFVFSAMQALISSVNFIPPFFKSLTSFRSS